MNEIRDAGWRLCERAGAVQGAVAQGDGARIGDARGNHDNHRWGNFFWRGFRKVFLLIAKCFAEIIFLAQTLMQINCDKLRITRVASERKNSLGLSGLMLEVRKWAQGHMRELADTVITIITRGLKSNMRENFRKMRGFHAKGVKLGLRSTKSGLALALLEQ